MTTVLYTITFLKLTLAVELELLRGLLCQSYLGQQRHGSWSERRRIDDSERL